MDSRLPYTLPGKVGAINQKRSFADLYVVCVCAIVVLKLFFTAASCILQ